jgi:hypothetical protein
VCVYVCGKPNPFSCFLLHSLLAAFRPHEPCKNLQSTYTLLRDGYNNMILGEETCRIRAGSGSSNYPLPRPSIFRRVGVVLKAQKQVDVRLGSTHHCYRYIRGLSQRKRPAQAEPRALRKQPENCLFGSLGIVLTQQAESLLRPFSALEEKSGLLSNTQGLIGAVALTLALGPWVAPGAIARSASFHKYTSRLSHGKIRPIVTHKQFHNLL